MKKSDYQLAILIGLLQAIFLVPTLIATSIFSYLVWGLLVVGLPPLMFFGLWLGNMLSKHFSFGITFSKYAAAGILSFTIDFATLNIISLLTGITSGFTLGWINMPGFAIATMNAYSWNKIWVFQKGNEGSFFAHFPKFFIVIVVGILINSTVLTVLATYVSAPFSLSPARWLNLAKIIATCAAITWNFIGYRFIAFR